MFWLYESVFYSPFSFIVSCVIVITTWNYLYLVTRRRGMPPGPISFPFIGTMYVIGKATEMPYTIAKLSEKYGTVFSLQTPTGSCIVVITDPKMMRETFVRNTDSAGRPFGDLRVTTQKIFNPHFPKAGVVFSDYDEQLRLQRNISMVVLRSLGYGKKSIENKIVAEAEHLAEALVEYSGASINPTRLINNAVANIICSLLFDERYNYNDADFQDLQETTRKVFEYLQKTVPLDHIWFYKYLPWGRRLLKHFKETSDKMNKFVFEKIEGVKKEMKAQDEANNFISVYLKEVTKSGGKLEDRSNQLVKDFFAAGAETTSTTLGWCLYFMAKYPEVQLKIRNEINTVVGDGKKPTLKDREKLPYVEATLNEVLRVASTAPGSLPHYTITDTDIAGYKIPKGTQVQALFASTIWDPTLFPEPHRLKPERHLDDEGQYLKNENLTPFGVGRRSCLGEQLARQELFLFFTHLIQSFEFKVPDGETLPPQKGTCYLTYRPPPYNISAVPIH